MNSLTRSHYDVVREGKNGYTVVFTNGCFDVLHPGHLRVLEHCRRIAGMHGVVVVGVNSDESIRRLKGDDRPIFTLNDRIELLKGVKYVDYVISFDDDTPEKLIKEIRPNFIVKGGDYKPYEVVGGDISHVIVVQSDYDLSTSKIIKRISNE